MAVLAEGWETTSIMLWDGSRCIPAKRLDRKDFDEFVIAAQLVIAGDRLCRFVGCTNRQNFLDEPAETLLFVGCHDFSPPSKSFVFRRFPHGVNRIKSNADGKYHRVIQKATGEPIFRPVDFAELFVEA